MYFIFNVIVFTLTAALIAITVVALYDDFAGNNCIAKGTKMGVRVEHTISTGCMANIDGQFVPLENVRFVKINGVYKPITN